MAKIINILSWLGLLGLMGVLMSFSAMQKEKQDLKDLEIFIDQPANSRFITEDNIKKLFRNLGYGGEGSTLNDVDVNHFESVLLNKPSIETANVFKTISGNIVVEIKEREPIVRVYNQMGESFYLDCHGSLMPLSAQYSARVMVATGNINIPYSTVYTLEDLEERINRIFRKRNTTAVQNTDLINKLRVEETELPGAMQLKSLFKLARFVHSDEFWRSQISQVYVNDKGDIELIPRVGNHVIILGTTEDMEEKFNKLMTFYTKGLNKTGWNGYSTINLKYKNQVVCTKR